MTTKITVHALHGWPVDVMHLHPETNAAAAQPATTRVPAGETMDFYIHSTLDLRIHEVQPDEIAADPAATDASAAG